MAEFPRDQFDEVPESLGRVGAHRAPLRRGRGWILVAWAALVSGVLVVAGLLGVSLLDDRLGDLDGPAAGPSPTATASPEPEVEPITDPTTVELPEGFTITILNGAGVRGLGGAASDVITPLGWPVGSVTNAAQSDIETTTVFYRDAAQEGIALGMVELLGVGEVALSEDFPGASITIVLGADYADLQG